MAETTIIPDGQKPYNLEPNIETMLAYLPVIGGLTSLAVFIMEKENKYVRFHALQGLFLAIFYFVAKMFINKFLIILPFTVVSFLLRIFDALMFLTWGFMMVKAYNNEKFQLPFIGKIAEDQIK